MSDSILTHCPYCGAPKCAGWNGFSCGSSTGHAGTEVVTIGLDCLRAQEMRLQDTISTLCRKVSDLDAELRRWKQAVEEEPQPSENGL